MCIKKCNINLRDKVNYFKFSMKYKSKQITRQVHSLSSLMVSHQLAAVWPREQKSRLIALPSSTHDSHWLSALHCTHGAFFIFWCLCWIREGGWGSAAVTHPAKMFSFLQPCSFLIWAKWTSWGPHVSLSQLRACHPCHMRTHNHSVPHQGTEYASSDSHSSGDPLL